MRTNLVSAGIVLSLASLLPSRTIGEQAPAGHLDAVELQQKAQSALLHIQQNDVGQNIVDATSYIELAAHVEPGRVIPVLESYFNRSHESELRGEIASVLVSLGDKNSEFWDLIVEEARAAVREDPPDPFEIGGDGKPSGLCSSDAFVEWAKRRGLRREEACKEASLEIPQRLRPLSDSGDRRGIPVLEQALHSRNRLMRGLAAQGLVTTGDKDAITHVIAAVGHAPKEEASELVQSLIESDDPRAESVVHQYLPEINFREAHDFHAERAKLRRPILVRDPLP